MTSVVRFVEGYHRLRDLDGKHSDKLRRSLVSNWPFFGGGKWESLPSVSFTKVCGAMVWKFYYPVFRGLKYKNYWMAEE